MPLFEKAIIIYQVDEAAYNIESDCRCSPGIEQVSAHNCSQLIRLLGTHFSFF